MILDILENKSRYFSLSNRFEKAFSFLMQPDLAKLAEGRHEIDGDNIYAVVAKDMGRAIGDALLETHEKYIDIQLILAGIDVMGWLPKVLCEHPDDTYSSESDLQFFQDEPSAWFSVKPGVFAIFFPEDAHLPMISSGEIHKVVVKVAISQD